ncbi:MAG: hypothetical protein E5Y79_30435 [Mesorhizobium sp.]|nr:MAG: hypothetical protein E5Y79_30435 [Mesorhizobium sp.]
MAGCKRWRLAQPSLHFVIPGRSKERSDAAQTLGSIPLRRSAAAVQTFDRRGGAKDRYRALLS